MAVSTAPRTNAASRKLEYLSIPMQAAKACWQYTEVCVDANGLAQMAADTAGLIHLGYALETADNSAGAASAISVKVIPNPLDRYREFNASSALQAWVGDLVSFVDDNTVALPATTTNDICAGRVVKLISASKVLVDTEDKHAFVAAA